MIRRRGAWRALAIALLALLPLAAPAQPGAPERIPFKEDAGELGALMWRSFLAMAGIVVVAAGVLYVLRRQGMVPPGRGPSRTLRVVESLKLGPRAALVVVHFGGQRMLIGQTDRGMELIATEPLDAEPLKPSPPETERPQ